MNIYELLIVWCVLNIVTIFFILILWNKNINFSLVNPIVIYSKFRVNWFGDIFISVLANLLFPLISIMYWFYELCTFGR